MYNIYCSINPDAAMGGNVFNQALFIGTIMTATSVSITVQALRELGHLKSRIGTTIVSAAIIDDVIGIIVLTVVIGIEGGKDDSGFAITGQPIADVFIKTGLFIAFSFGVGFLMYFLFKFLDKKFYHQRRIPIFGLVLCFLMAYCAETFFLIQDVVADEDWYDEHSEIGITEAQHIRKSYQVGDRVVTPLKTKDFGRIAAQTAKHVIRQGIREAERSQQLSEIQSRAHDIVQATVTRVDPEKGIVALDLGKGGEAILPRNEQVPGEVYTEGQSLQVYVVDVVSTERGPRVMISRTHPGLVKRLFELEVPEIFDGTVEVKAISREAGARTKMAVWSKDPNVNPVSACIGEHGSRVAAVVEKLGGEKIDIVKWSEDVSEFISAALSPAKVVKVELLPGETRSCRVTVPDQQLSLAIGNKGQNARLCARLTGYNIDIRPESGYYGEDEEPQKKEEAADAE